MPNDIEMLGLIEPLDAEELINSAALVDRNRQTGWKDLPESDRAFAIEYITNGFNYADAAETIGLARTSGIRKLRAPLVQGFIAYIQDQRAKASLITREFVEQQYLEILPKLKGEESVQLITPQGDSYEAKKFHSGEVVSVLRDLGKAAGFTPEEVGHSAPVNIQINIGDLAGDDNFVVEINDDESDSPPK